MAPRKSIRSLPLSLLAAAMVALSWVGAWGQDQAPGGPAAFDAYPVGAAYRGHPVMPDFAGRDRAFRLYRTAIRSDMAEGPNFAGHFRIVQLGCGTGCSLVFVADVARGQVHAFPLSGEAHQALELEYRVESRLVRAQWVPEVPDWEHCLEEDLTFDGRRFTALALPRPVTCRTP
jgi:hypothetical protein